jgi:hypothetical protein
LGTGTVTDHRKKEHLMSVGVSVQGREQVETRGDLPTVWPDPLVPKGTRGCIVQRHAGSRFGVDDFVVDFGDRQMMVSGRDLRKPTAFGNGVELVDQGVRIAGVLLALVAVVVILKVLVGFAEHAVALLIVLMVVRSVIRAFLR